MQSTKIPEFVNDLVYILNYKAGQPSLFEVHGEEQVPWLKEHDPDAALPTQEAALLDAPIDYDPDAWHAIDSKEGMVVCRDRLRPMVKWWLQSGCDVSKWAGVNQLMDDLNQLTVRLFKTDDGTAGFRLVKPHGYNANTAEIWATEYMFRYITSPFYGRIGRCARPICNQYFFKRTNRGNQVFCSGKTCGKNFHAVKSKKAGDKKNREQKLKRVRRAIEKFQKLTPTKQAEIAVKPGLKS